jgi:hypothetical protein
VERVLARLLRGDATFGEDFAGGRIEVDPRFVRLVPAPRKSPTRSTI